MSSPTKRTRADEVAATGVEESKLSPADAAAAAVAEEDAAPPAKKSRPTVSEPATLKRSTSSHVMLTTHYGAGGTDPVPLKWFAEDPSERGPVVATFHAAARRNAIGAHSGSYCVYRGIAVASGALDPTYKPDLSNTHPMADIGPHPSWWEENKIATIDPWGHLTTTAFKAELESGLDIRPTIAVTRAHMDIPEVKEALRLGRLKADGTILSETGAVKVTKAAVEPVWYLPEIARRFGCTEPELRRSLFEETNGMYPELLTRGDLDIWLPPIGGLTIYIFGDVEAITDDDKELVVRVHDECNGSDVFGSDICTCRPYLVHALEVCVETAQKGGAGVLVYFRKEGRALGEVTKYLVYNARKRQEGGDRAEEYFNMTEKVAGVQDVRFQAMMPDALHWLGITRIDRFLSMSNMKYDAVIASGIEIVERVPLPADLIPADAHVEIDAKVFEGYHGGEVFDVSADELKKVKGRGWAEHAH